MGPANEPRDFYDPSPDDDWTDVDTLLESGAPALSFPEVGTQYTGVVVKAEAGEQTDIDGNVRTYDDGRPRRQVVITLATDYRDDENPDDDGTRRLFVKSFMTRAMSDGLRRAGNAKLRRGGTITVEYTGDGEPTKKGLNPPKLFVIDYLPPSS